MDGIISPWKAIQGEGTLPKTAFLERTVKRELDELGQSETVSSVKISENSNSSYSASPSSLVPLLNVDPSSPGICLTASCFAGCG